MAIGKLRILAPIICASGTFGYGDELVGLADYKSIGAIVTKTITLAPRSGNPPPRIYETGCGVINSVGLENPGLEGFIKDKLPLIKKVPVQCIISVGGFTQEEYEAVIGHLDKQSEISAFEINLSCPNIRMKKLISQDANATYDLVKGLRRLTQKTLIVKVTPEVTDITAVAKAVQEAGADAVSLVNTFLAMAVNIETAAPYIGNGYGGYSGRAIKPMALYRVWRAASSVKIPVIGGGGIETAQDALEFFLAGASAVSLGTVNMVEPDCAKKILKGITDYLKGKKLNDIKQIIGTLKMTEEG